MASAPAVVAPSLTLTPAQTLTPIEQPAASVIAANTVLSQTDIQPPAAPTPAAPTPITLTPELKPFEAMQPSPEAVQSPTAPTIVGSAPVDTPALPDVEPRQAVASTSPAKSPTIEPVASPTRQSSVLGLGLGRLQIRVDGARERTTSRAVDLISGTIIGGEVRRLEVQAEGTVTAAKVDGRTFSAPVSLRPGLNHVRVVAADANGEVEENVTIQYNVPIKVSITDPPDGHTLTLADAPLVVVRGEVNDPSVSSVWLVVGERRVAVPVTSGRFRSTVAVLEPTVRMRVETPAMDNRSPSSATVAVHGVTTPTLALLLHWPNDVAVPVEVSAAWRPRADRLDGPPQRVMLRTAQDDTRLTAFYLRDPQPGVYAFTLRSASGAAQSVQPTLYVSNAVRGLRILPPMALNGSGSVLLARVLMPHGVLWEQDDWFTGRSASGDAVTKFRFPEGISWTERIGNNP